MKEKLNKTIENICDWIDSTLEDSLTVADIDATSGMVFALAELVAARADQDLEKRVADLEVQVQSQQKITLNAKEIADGLKTLLREELQERNT